MKVVRIISFVLQMIFVRCIIENDYNYQGCFENVSNEVFFLNFDEGRIPLKLDHQKYKKYGVQPVTISIQQIRDTEPDPGSGEYETIDDQEHKIPEGVMTELPFQPPIDKNVTNVKPMKLMVFFFKCYLDFRESSVEHAVFACQRGNDSLADCDNCVMTAMHYLRLDDDFQILDCDGQLVSNNEEWGDTDYQRPLFFYRKIERYPNGNIRTFIDEGLDLRLYTEDDWTDGPPTEDTTSNGTPPTTTTTTTTVTCSAPTAMSNLEIYLAVIAAIMNIKLDINY